LQRICNKVIINYYARQQNALWDRTLSDGPWEQDRNNLTKSEIDPCLCSPGLTVWLQFKLLIWLGVPNPDANIPFPCGQGPHVKQRVAGPQECTCHIASKSVQRFKHGVQNDRRQTDRPRYGEKCRNRRNRLRHKSDSAIKAAMLQDATCKYCMLVWWSVCRARQSVSWFGLTTQLCRLWKPWRRERADRDVNTQHLYERQLSCRRRRRLRDGMIPRPGLHPDHLVYLATEEENYCC